MIAPNDGTRPSRLALDRYATGELEGEARSALEASMGERERRHLDAVEATRAQMPPIDLAAIRRRAEAPAPANDDRGFRALRRGYGLLAAVAVAAAALVAVALGTDGTPGSGTGGVRIRGAEAIEIYQVVGDEVHPYGGETALGESDVIGFRLTNPGHFVGGPHPGHCGVVLLSVDGRGTVSVFYPAEGEEPELLPTDGTFNLPDTVILDGAPGPEIFVAVFDTPVSEATAELERRFEDGGARAVEAWAERAPGVVSARVIRR